jgi:rRNA processing protein Gar1
MSDKILLGRGMHQSKGNKNLIITLSLDARIGQPVADKNGKLIGMIFDIFGPIGAPYASIKLNDGVQLGKIAEKPVFLGRDPPKKRRDRKRRDRKRRRSR